MFTRFLIVMTILTIMVSACAPARGTDVLEIGIEPATETNSNQAIKDELGPVAKAMLGGNLGEQIAVIQYSQIACANVEGLGGPPPCPEGVAEGTKLQVFPIFGSESSFIAPENMETFLNNSILKNLYAIYRVTPNPNIEPYFPEGRYAMLFERSVNDISLPVVLRVMDGKIVRMDFSIGAPAADLLKGISVENMLVTPQEAQAWTESVRSTPPIATSYPSGIGVGITEDLCPNVIVNVGQQITWTNQGANEHIVRDITIEGSSLFDSGPLKSGDTFAFNFLQPQSYKYECSTDGSLIGTISVEP